MDYDILADEYIESTALVTIKVQHTKKQILKQLFNFHKFVRANSLSSYVASLQTTCFSKQNHIYPKISKYLIENHFYQHIIKNFNFSNRMFASRSLLKSLVRAKQYPLDHCPGSCKCHDFTTCIHRYATDV